MNLEQRNIPLDAAETRIENREDGTRVVSGYAAVYHRTGDAGTEYPLFRDTVERIKPGAFNTALVEDDVRGLFNHSPDLLLGRTSSGTLRLSVNKRGLRYEYTVDPDDPDHQRVARKIDRGDLSGSSFSFRVRSGGERFFEEDRDGVKITVRELTDLQLYDVGPVTFPAYSGTTTEMAKRSLDRWQSERFNPDEILERRQRLLELEIK